MKHILIIEDSVDVVLGWREALRRFPFNFIVAENLEKAEVLFPVRNWDVIVVDGCLGGDDFNTEALVHTIREQGYTGPMIAASKSPDIRRLLIRAGCDEESPKEFIPTHILDVLSH